jgi:hypothetical protein
MITVQSYINSFFAIRRGLSYCILLRFVLHGTEFRVVFSSAEWFGTEFREFAFIFGTRNGIPSCFLLRGRVWNGIPRVCFYFCSTEQNSELFPLLRKSSERNSERFLFRGTAGIPSEIPLCSVYSVFRGIIFLSEIPNPTTAWLYRLVSSRKDRTCRLIFSFLGLSDLCGWYELDVFGICSKENRSNKDPRLVDGERTANKLSDKLFYNDSKELFTSLTPVLMFTPLSPVPMYTTMGPVPLFTPLSSVPLFSPLSLAPLSQLLCSRP